MMKHFSKFAVAAALSLVAGVANAATISFSSVIPETATDFTGNATLQKFDTNLGTLNTVTFALTGDTTVNWTVKNNSAATHKYQVNGSADMTFTLLSANVVEVIPGISQLTPNITSGSTGAGSFSGTASTTFDDTANKALYEQSGTHLFNNAFAVSGLAGESGTVPFDATNTQSGGATFTVTYDYTEAPPPPPMAPEPASIALLTMGAVGMIARRRAK